MKIGVVIPCGAGRDANVLAVLQAIEGQETKPDCLVLVLDGPDAVVGPDGGKPQIEGLTIPYVTVRIPKHIPGMEQPRNVGVRVLRSRWPEVTHAWFLDSDVIVEPDCLDSIIDAYEVEALCPECERPLEMGHDPECSRTEDAHDRIMICPYDWLPPGPRHPIPDLHNDPRWPSFEKYAPENVLRNDLAAGLACFSGNLVWPLDQFERVGGFWNELHHGRCEDGELGLRAVAMDVPISFAPLARGWHLYHDVNAELAIERNTRDVPMLNERHPWVEGSDVFMVDRDGKAFDVRCGTCHEVVPTILWWQHAKECSGEYGIPVAA